MDITSLGCLDMAGLRARLVDTPDEIALGTALPVLCAGRRPLL